MSERDVRNMQVMEKRKPYKTVKIDAKLIKPMKLDTNTKYSNNNYIQNPITIDRGPVPTL